MILTRSNLAPRSGWPGRQWPSCWLSLRPGPGVTGLVWDWGQWRRGSCVVTLCTERGSREQGSSQSVRDPVTRSQQQLISPGMYSIMYSIGPRSPECIQIETYKSGPPNILEIPFLFSFIPDYQTGKFHQGFLNLYIRILTLLNTMHVASWKMIWLG